MQRTRLKTKKLGATPLSHHRQRLGDPTSGHRHFSLSTTLETRGHCRNVQYRPSWESRLICPFPHQNGSMPRFLFLSLTFNSEPQVQASDWGSLVTRLRPCWRRSWEGKFTVFTWEEFTDGKGSLKMQSSQMWSQMQSSVPPAIKKLRWTTRLLWHLLIQESFFSKILNTLEYSCFRIQK